ncbi:hypothetical protein IU500_20090 [Nocardia terpenica]|uniref:Uncharacterized protein n=1 Tax=Nocardia terpenica TaxID=455432 RepID=A0A161WG50_9NOCA|nr:hypothetical protein [Nocardia terpenica]KZM75959.1 hypothetical protein AWN90_16685 [Nocardia terpenica]MBF6061862.1 hypothetical protein [Nocardia terpenica]MBF6106337.1 hypothetical protein [Nocardia terpenica]MBF6110282.1 hypothetical protein [Nocardia terpenica]MBF6120881.1 hypothetical protein [Nocardia terpenica]
MIKTVFAAGAIALGVLTVGTGLAAADEIQVEGNYATLAACQADGPEVQVDRDNDKWTHWDCRQGGDGLFYLYLSN